MTKNVGRADRFARIVVGLGLIAFALHIGFPTTNWNWIGWIGIVPLVTGLARNCPAYSIFGIST